MSISIRPAEGITDFLFLRDIRNQNRQFMTGTQEKITLIQQFRFWRSRPEVYIAEIDGLRVGYLLIKGSFITECVSPKFRGFGIGLQLVEYAKSIKKDLIAVIRTDNITSIRLHHKAGFQLVPAFIQDGTYTYCWHAK